MEIPDLKLAHGQVAWVLATGKTPSAELLAQLRYLRQIGLPSSLNKEVGTGRSAQYDYYDLVELGLALFALRRGVQPKNIKAFLVTERETLRELYKDVLERLPADTLQQPWVKSRGEIAPLGADRYIRIHDRYFEKAGTLKRVMGEEAADRVDKAMMKEIHPDGWSATLAPVGRIALELVAWALEAPIPKKGPR